MEGVGRVDARAMIMELNVHESNATTVVLGVKGAKFATRREKSFIKSTDDGEPRHLVPRIPGGRFLRRLRRKKWDINATIIYTSCCCKRNAF